MKARDLFKVLVALVGVVCAVYGLLNLTDGIVLVLRQTDYGRAASGYAIRGVAELILGVLIVRGFPPFVEMAFPQEGEVPRTPPEAASHANPGSGELNAPRSKCVACGAMIPVGVGTCPECKWTQPGAGGSS